MPAISVIVPVYKAEPYLHRCVDSILQQTYTDFELILVDDGSPDNCPAICDEYAARDSRVRVIHKENGGVSAARNAGLDAARGDYITFADSDDWIAADFLRYTISCCNNGMDMVICGFSRMDNDERHLYDSVIESPIRVENRPLGAEERTALLQASYISGPCGKLIRKECIEDVRFDPSLCFGEDLKFIYTVLKHGRSLLAVPEAKYCYRDNPGSLINVVTAKKCASIRDAYSFMLADCVSEYGKQNNVYTAFLKQRLFGDYCRTLTALRKGSRKTAVEGRRELFRSRKNRRVFFSVLSEMLFHSAMRKLTHVGRKCCDS